MNAATTTDWDRSYGVQNFVVLAHLPLVVEVSTALAMRAVSYVAVVSVAVPTLVTTLGWPALAREYGAEIGVAEAFFVYRDSRAVSDTPRRTRRGWPALPVPVVLVAAALWPVVTARTGR